jgi:hypothetical protein
MVCSEYGFLDPGTIGARDVAANAPTGKDDPARMALATLWE